MKERLIFLDIDGVLNGHLWMKSPFRKMLKGSNYESSRMICRYNLFLVGLLCRLTHCKVIMSSSWRYFWGEDGYPEKSELGERYIKTDNLLRKYGVKVVGKTTTCVESLKEHEYNQPYMEDYLNKKRPEGLDITEEKLLHWARGSQILDWLDKNNYQGNYAILEDDYYDVIIYKELANHIVISKFYGKKYGFRLKQFFKAYRILTKK